MEKTEKKNDDWEQIQKNIEEILKKFEEIQFAFLSGKNGVLYSWQKNMGIAMGMSTTFWGSAARIFLALNKSNLDNAVRVAKGNVDGAAIAVSFGKMMAMRIQEGYLIVLATSEANLKAVSEDLTKAIQNASKERKKKE